MAKPSRLQDFTTSGVKSGTFPNAAGRSKRVDDYYLAVENDLASQKKARAKLSGKTGTGKINPKAKAVKTLPPIQSDS